MKQLPMTPALSAMIKEAVGDDVDPSNFAVFESVSLNTQPLPGKNGTIFEGAVITPATLQAMADNINGGNHLPLIADHELMGAPKGRVFHAGVHYDVEDGVQLRTLFYLDETETDLITKLNAGSLDEVSVAFLSESFQCSECGWDYFAEGEQANFSDRTCANGHTIGEDGVHAVMNGLSQFIELSVVARGAADKPKIVGKSDAKLAPDAFPRLAASGYELDDLVVQASLGTKDDTMDLSALTTQLSTANQQVGTLTAERDQARTELSARDETIATLTSERDEALGQVTTLTAERDELAARPEQGVADERDAAVTYLQSQYTKLMVASGKDEPKDDDLPSTVAELTAKIDELTGNLTSILPVGGKAVPAGGTEDDGTAELAFNPDAFKLRA